ncbi:MAG TPA: glycoside hydrolase family 3 N-terminal domain-containing protein [Bryobacteraceae bacterium]|jgi:beta-N-acetylhexosaminidase|nr:glycoside hydrolase family 3 N-terminal domain-containing protein [Bryobacteraceae bacterium]
MVFARALVCCCAVVPLLNSLCEASAASPKTGTAAASTQGALPSAAPLLRSLSLHDRIAQLIVVRGYGDYPPTDNAEYRKFVHWIRDDRVGGFIVAGRIRGGNVISAQPFEMAAFINHMQRLARTPLLVASDFERGASMRVADTARFPYLMAFGAAHDLAATKELGAATAREARALGVTWIFAPDADVNNNPDNPIINVRSYGEDPQQVAAGVSAFIEGAHSARGDSVLVTAKHFPGHGDTATDSHLQMARLDQSKERIESVELAPFRAAIEHRVDAIMTAHMAVPAFDAADVPATISQNVLTGLLRQELGFKGIIVTDAMEMQGLASLYSQGEAAVRAVEAGADVLLMPTDPDVCIRALTQAVERKRISLQRIDASASKILAAKRSVGLFRTRLVALDSISDDLEEQKLGGLAQSVAERAVTLVKDDKHLFPMAAGDGACLIIIGERQFSQRGETLLDELHRRTPNLTAYVVNPYVPDNVLSFIAIEASHCKQIYVAAFVTVAANRGSVALEGGLNTFMNTIVHSSVPVALIALGNPYLLRDFPDVSAYLATFSTASTSETAAARAMLGEIPITGRMPVSIPGLAKLGTGMDVPAKANLASNRAE